MDSSTTRNLSATAIPMPIHAIEAFCKRWQVKEFALFGSVFRADFRPDSDVDLMVVFEPEAHPTFFELGDMQEELEALFSRNVDIVTRKSIERSVNWYRKKFILDGTEIIYARCCLSSCPCFGQALDHLP
jgi:predicted nucleotidyltransferase